MSQSTQVMYPSFVYSDAPAALQWMKDVLGAEEVAVHTGDEGRDVVHGEARIAGAIVMFGSLRPGNDAFARPPGLGAVYIAIDDPDARHERAVAAGADVLLGLTDTDYGSRDFGLRDPEGNQWFFGTYRP